MTWDRKIFGEPKAVDYSPPPHEFGEHELPPQTMELIKRCGYKPTSRLDQRFVGWGSPIRVAEQIRSLYACIDALERRVKELEHHRNQVGERLP